MGIKIMSRKFLKKHGIVRDDDGRIGEGEHARIIYSLYDDLSEKALIYARAAKSWLEDCYIDRSDRDAACVCLDRLTIEMYDIRFLKLKFVEWYQMRGVDIKSITTPGNEPYALCYRSLRHDTDELIKKLDTIMINARGQEKWKNHIDYVKKRRRENFDDDNGDV